MSAEVIYYGPHVERNKKKLQYVDNVMCLSLGVAAGTLSIETMYGFLLYGVGMVVTNVGFVVMCCEGDPGKYFRNPVQEVFVQGLSNVAGFIMTWCLVYALVQ